MKSIPSNHHHSNKTSFKLRKKNTKSYHGEKDELNQSNPSSSSWNDPPPPHPINDSNESFFKFLITITLLAFLYELIQVASIRASSPLFGSIYSHYQVNFFCTLNLILGWLICRFMNFYSLYHINPKNSIQICGSIIIFLLAIVPWIRDELTLLTSTKSSFLSGWIPTNFISIPLTAFWQAQLTYMVSLYPISFLMGYLLGTLSLSIHFLTFIHLNKSLAMNRTLIPLIWFSGTRLAQKTLHHLDLDYYYIWNPHRLLAFIALGLPALFLWKSSMLVGKLNSLAGLGILLTTWSFFYCHHLQSYEGKISISSEYTQIERSNNVQILFDHGRDAMLMRHGHSLLGGMYRTSGDSVYSGFYLHDLHNLIISRKKPIERVLIIGYGIGIAASTWTRSNISIDAVDIDPDVIRLARTHFPVIISQSSDIQQFHGIHGPRAHHGNFHFHVADGKAFLDATPAETYDVIIHDVFSGGSIVPELVSPSMIQSIQKALTSDGTFSLNWVGQKYDLSLSIMGNTLSNYFSSVRCFQEHVNNVPDTSPHNFVFFGGKSLKFRPPTRMDALESVIRWHTLTNLKEISVYTNGTWNRDTIFQSMLPLAQLHFEMMRNLIPLKVWLHY